MKRSIFVAWVCVVVWGLATQVWAQERIIKLKDGSVFKGEVVSKSGDVYKIKSATVGMIAVRDADVAAIEDPALAKPAVPAQAPPQAKATLDASTVAAAAPPVPADYKSYQDKILSNPESMSAIQALTQDKDVLDIVNDPQLKQAILSGNVDYLKNNEKFLKFANNPAVKKITESVVGPQQGAPNGGQDKDQSGK